MCRLTRTSQVRTTEARSDVQLRDLSDEVLSDLGLDIDKRGWFFKDEAGVRNLTRQAYKNYNMFYNPVFLHSRPILTLNNPDKSTKVQETLGTIDLEKTFLPENVAAQVNKVFPIVRFEY